MMGKLLESISEMQILLPPKIACECEIMRDRRASSRRLIQDGTIVGRKKNQNVQGILE
jgi:hypothetical protein